MLYIIFHKIRFRTTCAHRDRHINILKVPVHVLFTGTLQAINYELSYRLHSKDNNVKHFGFTSAFRPTFKSHHSKINGKYRFSGVNIWMV